MEGWHAEACSAASLREGPDPARSRDTEFFSPNDFAASTALIDEALTQPPSCSAKTNVLSYFKREKKYKKTSYASKLPIWDRKHVPSKQEL